MKDNVTQEDLIQFVLSDDISSVDSILTDEEKLLFYIWFLQQIVKYYRENKNDER